MTEENTMRLVPYKEMGCQCQECFGEVAKKVKRYGGRPVYSWIVVERDYWIAHLHHCLWETPYKELVCITPQDIFDRADRQVIIDEDAKPFTHARKMYGLPARHFPKLNAKWCIACCKAMDEASVLQNEAIVDISKKRLAIEAEDKADYWILKGTKGEYAITKDAWLRAA